MTAPAEARRNLFSRVELAAVLALVVLLAGVVAPRLGGQLKTSRDARRLADVRQLRAAIEQFRHDRGAYPPADTNPAFGNWDVSHDGGFIQVLVDEGYLRQPLADPVNDDTYHYRYYVYAGGSYGCQGDGAFFVLGIRAFENEDTGTRNRGFFRCATRDWGDEFAYVTGGGASWVDVE